jgi:hypothetical protein
MTLVSVAPVAEQALLARIRASPDFAGVGVLDVPVTDETAAPDVLYVDSIEFDQGFRGPLRPCSRNDDFTLNVVLLVRRLEGGSFAKQRAWDLVSALQRIIVADWTLGNVVNQACEVGGGVVSPYPATIEGAWEARADVRVRCSHVLTE